MRARLSSSGRPSSSPQRFVLEMVTGRRRMWPAGERKARWWPTSRRPDADPTPARGPEYLHPGRSTVSFELGISAAAARQLLSGLYRRSGCL